jgi:hypothetical protein
LLWGRGPGADGPCPLPHTPSPNPIIFLAWKVEADASAGHIKWLVGEFEGGWGTA